MKILRGSRSIWHGNVIQQRRRLGAQRRSDLIAGEGIAAGLSVDDSDGGGIENLSGKHRLARALIDDLRASRPQHRRSEKGTEVAATFGERGDVRESIVRRAATRAVPAKKEKRLVAAVENVGDVQRAADIGAESGLGVT